MFISRRRVLKKRVKRRKKRPKIMKKIIQNLSGKYWKSIVSKIDIWYINYVIEGSVVS